MRTVVFIKSLGKYPDRMKQAGIAEYARQHGWDLLSIDPVRSRASLRTVTDLWSPSGYIVNCSTGRNSLPPSAYGKTPVVFFTVPGDSLPPTICRVYNDARATARLAAQALLRLDLMSYGYVNWFKPISWNESRRQAFQEALAIHGKVPAAFSTRQAGPTHFTKSIVPWLLSLPKPAGLFAANDMIARLVANGCKLARLSIPDDVAIVGVDNDMEICEENSPSLTSIRLDHVESGRLAAQLLDRMMNARLRKPADVSFPCAEVVNRESTRRFACSDRLVSEAVERIRKEACTGLSAADVLKGFPCSRRTAENRFRTVTGRSILEEIRCVRLQKATELLRNHALNISFVAYQTGYSTLPAFSAFFKSETGLSPVVWRKRSNGAKTARQPARRPSPSPSATSC